MVGRGICEIQFQMSDELFNYITEYMRRNNMNIDKFAEYVKINKYMLSKIMDRKIKMHCYLSVLNKIGLYTDAKGIKYGDRQPTICTKECD